MRPFCTERQQLTIWFELNSVATVVGRRYVVHADADDQERRRKRKNWQTTLDELTKIRAEIEAESGVLSDDFLLHDREEREEELWQRMRSDG